MSLPHILLGLLREPATGYDLRNEFSTGAAHYWAAQLSQIYPTLKKMEDAGYLRSEEAPADRGPKRRMYTRTEAGQEELCTWIRSGPTVGVQRVPYVAQIEFAHEVGDLDVTLDLVRSLRTEFQPLRDLLVSVVDEVAGAATEIDFHELLAIRLGIRTLDARLAWCDEAEALILERRS